MLYPRVCGRDWSLLISSNKGLENHVLNIDPNCAPNQFPFFTRHLSKTNRLHGIVHIHVGEFVDTGMYEHTLLLSYAYQKLVEGEGSVNDRG